jgi:hypothetical protein
MGHYSRECLNLPALPTKTNVGFFIQRFFIEEKGKTQVHLIKPMSEGQKKALMGLERSLKIPKDLIDVSWPKLNDMENIIHPNT